MRILIVDDHALVREALRLLIQTFPAAEVVGEAANGREAVACTGTLRPDVVLMDIAMPELNGADAAARILAVAPETKVIALSIHADARHVLDMLEAGAAGYVHKSGTADELAHALSVVCSGRKFVSPVVAETVVDRALGRPLPPVEGATMLSRREREVLQLIAEGYSSKQIAGKLGLTVRTVETHRRQTMQKLQSRGIAELTKWAIRLGLTTINP
jgi:DNA-binding NarL/FixJ family response regulator